MNRATNNGDKENAMVTDSTKKNYAKRDSYALAFGMIATAIHHNFPLQAIAVEKNIISDFGQEMFATGRKNKSAK